jgi:hypothetical protein
LESSHFVHPEHIEGIGDWVLAFGCYSSPLMMIFGLKKINKKGGLLS